MLAIVLLRPSLLKVFYFSALLFIFSAQVDRAHAELPVYGYRILKTYPHDPQNFTQGLAIENGVVFEGTGQWSKSRLLQYDLASGKIHKEHRLPAQYFGEGIALTKNRIFQITYRSERGFVYDRETFQMLASFTYQGEGWGLTYDGDFLIMSNGSARLQFLHPDALRVQRDCEVTAAGQPVMRLNELEYVEGKIYANIWYSDRIAVIDARSCQVQAWIDLTDLLPAHLRRRADVLNGIAYDPVAARWYVTGKYWPQLFAVEWLPRNPP